jgi:hypothetical protein
MSKRAKPSPAEIAQVKAEGLDPKRAGWLRSRYMDAVAAPERLRLWPYQVRCLQSPERAFTQTTQTARH